MMAGDMIVGGYDPDRPLRIFVSQDDKTSTDITKMSDFIADEIRCLSKGLVLESRGKNAIVSATDKVSIADALMSDRAVIKDGFEYVLDFDSLPKDILKKYRKGIYKLGESRMVDGNLRAVIVNEKGIRVKDVTLKKVDRVANNAGQLQSLAIQSQLKQINEKLDTLIELQDYHIDFDRNNNLVKPFFNARDNVVHAQNEKDSERKRAYLDKAVSQLEDGINALYLDIDNIQKRLFRCTWMPVFRPTRAINKYIGYITQDLQLLSMYNSVLLQLFDYLGKPSDKMDAYNKYRTYMLGVYTKAVGNKQLPLSLQIHNAITYTKEDMDTWKTMTDNMVPVLQKNEAIEGAYILMGEDSADEAE